MSTEYRATRKAVQALLWLLLLFVTAVPAIVEAQSLTPPPPGVYSMPRRIYTNMETVPKGPRAGTSRALVGFYCDTSISGDCDGKLPPTLQEDGAIRFGCYLAWAGPYDKLVYANLDGVGHGHNGFGNVLGNKLSVVDMPNKGQGSCDGGILNRTGYWVPWGVYYCPEGSTDGCDRSRDGEWLASPFFQVYYKGAGGGAVGEASTVWFPEGHVMIAGDPNGTTENPAVSFSCIDNTSGVDVPSSDGYNRILTTAQIYPGMHCNKIRMAILAPNCGDGRTDSIGHQGHMAPNPFVGFYQCPAEFPVRYPSHSIIEYIQLKTDDDLNHTLLSSDYPKSMGYPPGSTAHFDRIEGFSDDTAVIPGLTMNVKDIILNGCLRALYDCHGQLLPYPNGSKIYYLPTPP